MTDREETAVSRRNHSAGLAFQLLVIVPTVIGLGLSVYLDPRGIAHPSLLLWIAITAGVELLPVPAWRGLQFSLSFPILLGVSILFRPWVAAVVAFVASIDRREFKKEISINQALFNRSQLSLAYLTAGTVFHHIASVHASPWFALLLASFAESTSAYVVNVVFVSTYMRLVSRVPPTELLTKLRVGALSEFLLSYLGLGFVGLIIARLYVAVDLWAVAAFILPLIFARQMFFRTLALEEASKELKDRERVLRALSNRMAEERQDERMQIAGYLHDDLAQMLFRLTLQAEMAKRRISQGDVGGVAKDIEKILATKEETSNAIRELIRDLHRTPMGRKGLGEAIASFSEDISRGHPTQISTDVAEVALPPPIQLLIYQIAREASMNALKHAEADHIWISLAEIEDGVRLQIRDDGRGFDTDAPPPEGHFGSVMMRERALVAGGTYTVTSEVGEGTTIAATFPRVWVEEGTALEAQTEDRARSDDDSQSNRRAEPAPAQPLQAVPAKPDPPPTEQPSQTKAAADGDPPARDDREESARPQTRLGWRRRARPAIPA